MPTRTAPDLASLAFLSSDPLPDCLQYLSRMAMRIPPRGHLLEWGQRALGLSPGDIPAWFARAWWGAAAARLVAERIGLGHADEVLALLLRPDTRPLERALEQGRGAILALSHLGPWELSRLFLQQLPCEVLILANHPTTRHLNIRVHDVSTEASRGRSLAASLAHLRGNGLLLAAGDGEFGGAALAGRFLGHDISFRTGLARLARLTSAPTLWFFVLWDPRGGGLEIRIEDSGLVPDPDPATWEARWVAAYAARLGSLMASRPESLGFRGGLWGDHEGAFFHPAPLRIWRTEDETGGERPDGAPAGG